MKKIEDFRGKACKKSGNGFIWYGLYVDEHGEFFVKFEDNAIPTDHPGTLSNSVYFSVRKYADRRNSTEEIGHPAGINEMNEEVTPSDNNNGAFLKAVLCDLLPS